ncbi:LGFP repeat-containing protein, partial [Kineococcus glutinatus]|uniref:LGFP repeat-containing protein n=1 Tax=Kineococcus glutinatus TaxID=1070872 RepID=UPI003CD06E2B
GGNIYWSPATGAHEVHGQILARYAAQGWENGLLGFPRTGEIRTPNGAGAYAVFEGGSVYWTARWGAWVTYGAIRDAWAGQGYENGCLGFPVTGEFDYGPAGTRVQQFEGGWISWTAAGGARVNAYPDTATYRDAGLYPRC